MHNRDFSTLHAKKTAPLPFDIATDTRSMWFKVPIHQRLRTRLIAIIATAVFILEIAIYLPMLANIRKAWLNKHFQGAKTISLVLPSDHNQPLNLKTQKNILDATSTLMIKVCKIDQCHTIAATQTPEAINHIVDLKAYSKWSSIRESLSTLLWGGNQNLLVKGALFDPSMHTEALLKDDDLRASMIDFTKYFIFTSLLISLVAAFFIYVILQKLLLKPLRTIYENMLDFVLEPDNPNRIMVPTSRRDELGLAQRRLASIESKVQRDHARQKHLANLGLAVSKINHDMHNILASAQLLSDRLAKVQDPIVQKVSPQLVAAIDRATKYSQSVITYGRNQELPPKRKRFLLHPFIHNVYEHLVIAQREEIDFQNLVPKGIVIDADEDQLHRIITNLIRNAIQTLNETKPPQATKSLIIEAERHGKSTFIHIKDNGPGLPLTAKTHLFSPFKGSTHRHGSGLGLAICEELIRAHGGSIHLDESTKIGAHFVLYIPDNPTTKKRSKKTLRIDKNNNPSK